jgi:hypothetical protein
MNPTRSAVMENNLAENQKWQNDKDTTDRAIALEDSKSEIRSSKQ